VRSTSLCHPSRARWRWTALPAATRPRRLSILPRRPRSERRERRERIRRATSRCTRRLYATQWAGEGQAAHCPTCLRHREAQREARRRRTLLPSGAFRFPPLGSTEARRAHGEQCVFPRRRCARRPRRTCTAARGAKHVLRTHNRVGNSYTFSFFIPSIR